MKCIDASCTTPGSTLGSLGLYASEIYAGEIIDEV